MGRGEYDERGLDALKALRVTVRRPTQEIGVPDETKNEVVQSEPPFPERVAQAKCDSYVDWS